MTADEMLAALREAAALEHAHLVHHLRLVYAFGGDPPDTEPAGTTVPAGVRQAAGAASLIAHDDMFHFRDVNRILVAVGQDPVLERATQVPGAGGAGTPVDLGPMTAAQFQHFPAREAALAAALDGVYGRLRDGLASAGAPFTGGVLQDVEQLVDSASGHVAGPPALAQLLDGLAPAQYLLVTGTEAADEVDGRLLAVSDDMYHALLSLLRDHFSNVDFGGVFLGSHARSRMDDLHAVNSVLVLRGFLAPFTVP